MKTYVEPNEDPIARRAALNTAASFIVQAPAGSGKTELLIQRYLALLAIVSHPEEILAVTFTRKAAREIQNRVIEALQNSFLPEPSEAHRAKTYLLAKQVVEQDRGLGWGLLENPNRMRILTIDALSHRIALQMPMASGLGADFKPSDDTRTLYQRAALELLLTLEGNEPWQGSLKTLLNHLHNHWALVGGLVVDLLKKRDQWLPHVIGGRQTPEPQIGLEQDLKRVIEYYLQKACSALNAGDKKELLELLQFASHPFTEIDKSLPLWKIIARLLLTEKGTWRRTANTSLGFPAPSSTGDREKKALLKERKERFEAFLGCLAHKGDLQELLLSIRLLPGGRYTDPQWKVLKALTQLLPTAVGFLKLQFRDAGVVDFVEVGEAARKALGEGEAPSQLALKLDYQISHCLIDEFQDTSFSQIRLLEKIIMGWEPGDGRTLFLVGDPMQSIYRFRQAEVGIFLQIQKAKHFFHLPLKSLHLHTNYRSSKQIVDWANQTFTGIFPERENSLSGAVTHCRSVPSEGSVNANDKSQDVFFHPIVAENGWQEAHQIASRISEIRNLHPDETIAILVRARPHLKGILEVLRVKELPYLALDIECAFNQPVIQDLLVLLRAMLSTADSVAWLSLLRSPCCGLTLDDLCVIAEKHSAPIWASLNNEDILNQLGSDGRERASRMVLVLRRALSRRYRSPLSTFLKNTWVSLGGPATYREKQAFDYAKLFFEFLEKESGYAHFVEIGLFQKKISQLFMPTFSDAHNPIQLMTIHRAKGLEFDHVILPGLERRGAADAKQLLLWLEHPTQEGTALLMSPLYGTHKEVDPLYQFLRHQMRQKEHFELARLLYVAATRAKKNLYLFASNAENNWDKAPTGSFLELLMPALPHTKRVNMHPIDSVLSNPHEEKFAIHRISQQTVVELSQSVSGKPMGASKSSNIISLKQGGASKAVGTLLHRILHLLATVPPKDRHKINWKNYHPSWRNALLRLGVPHLQCDASLEQVYFGLQNILTCPKAAWILDPHLNAFSEYKITGILAGEVIEGVIDRTFVDQTGNRWIVDYKTARPGMETREEFYRFQKSQHEPQLTRYAELLKLNAGEPIYLGLYFPFIRGWHEWSYHDTNDCT